MGLRLRDLPALALLAGPCLAQGCGYHSLLPRYPELAVAPVLSRAPDPELAACLTAELREGLAARGVRLSARAPRTLEAEVLEETAGPDSIAVRESLVPAEEAVEVVLRVRVVGRGEGALWGPRVFRLARRSAEGPTSLASAASLEIATAALCRDLASQVLDALAE